MTLREKTARALYAKWSSGCLVPFEQQGDLTQGFCYSLADAALDQLTAVPCEQAILAGIRALRDGRDTYDPVGFYRGMVLTIWHNMVEAMVPAPGAKS